MKTKLSLRERKFIDAYVENGGNATQAYLIANPLYKGNYARKLGHRMWTKVDIVITELMDEMGLTDATLIQKLKDGLNATKETGIGIHTKEVTDYSVIVKYLDMALKLKGSYPSEKHDVNIKGEHRIIVEVPEDLE